MIQAETVGLQVAVKQFHRKDDYVKENAILQQIKDLQDRHIIQHFASIDQGRKGYIIFPWADGGNLEDFWECSEYENSPERVLWSLRQMLGLTEALSKLHRQFKCRHGDLKPGNILCVTEGNEIVLKIADFGISSIHLAATISRKKATKANMLTPSYQGPEVEFENLRDEEQIPRSRKYDIWSLGCVFLEFSIWLLHGAQAIKEFAGARGNGTSSAGHSTPLYEVTDKGAKAASVHRLVSWTIGTLQNGQKFKGETALADLLSLINDQMLQPEVDNRPWAHEICNQLEEIVQKAEESNSYLFPTSYGIPSLNFEDFK